MSHALVLQGVAHEVWLARRAGHYGVTIDNALVTASLIPRGEHMQDLVVGDDGHRVFVAVRGDDIHVHLDGEAHVLRHVHSLERFAGADAGAAASVARAPMPGAVIAVHVSPGQAVERGAPLLVIESMKMETVIAASQDGVVEAVHVAVGQTFDRDAPLVTLERREAAA